MRVIAGKARRLLLDTPAGKHTRPTSDKIKETLFNILQSDIADCDFLDIFAGSGGIGIEALSRGAKKAVFIENNRAAIACIEKNLAHTGFSAQAEVIPMEALRAMDRLQLKGASFDVIFMDPPYDKGFDEQALVFLSHSQIAGEDTLLVLEEEIHRDLSFIEDLGFVVERVKEYKTNKHIFFRKAQK